MADRREPQRATADDPRRHPPTGRRRGARPVAPTGDRGRRAPLDPGQPLPRPPLRDRPRSRARDPATAPAHPGHGPRHPAAAVPRRPTRRLRPLRPDRRRRGRGDPRCSHRRRPASGASKVGDHGGVGEIAWSPDGRRAGVHRRGRSAPVHRRARSGRSRGAEVDRRRHARCPPHHPHRLALGRGGASRPLVAPVRRSTCRRGRPRQVTSGDWGVSRHRLASRRPDTSSSPRDRGPEPDLHPRTTIWAVDVDAASGEDAAAARDPGPRRLGQPPGGLARRTLGRGRSACSEPEPLDDVSPSILLAPADGSAAAAPIDLAPDLDRPIGNWVDTDLTGWMVSGRHGPCWLDDARIVATISDRGRSHPHVLPTRRRRPAGRDRPRPTPRDGDIVTHTVAVAPTGRGRPRLAALATDGAGRWSSQTVDLARRPARATDLRHPLDRSARAWQRASRRSRCGSSRRPGAGGPIDVWIASPAGAGDGPLPTDRRRPRRPARRVGADAAHRGHPAGVGRLPGRPAQHPRLGRPTAATGSGRSSATGAASMPRTSMPPSTTSSRSASPTRSGSA